MQPMVFRQATADDLEPVAALMARVTAELNAQGILQWDASYPSRMFLEEALADDTLFVLSADGELVGATVLDEWQAPQWMAIPWQHREAAVLVIHALVIDPARHGRGYGAALVQHCECWARKHGYGSIRIDAFAGNGAALRLYERLGYVYRGDVEFRSKPAGHQRYRCYEKSLSMGSDPDRL